MKGCYDNLIKKPKTKHMMHYQDAFSELGIVIGRARCRLSVGRGKCWHNSSGVDRQRERRFSLGDQVREGKGRRSREQIQTTEGGKR